MPRNGSGGYALDPSTWNPGVDGVTATTSDWNVKVKADLETAIAGSVAADGQTPMSGALDMGNNRVTNVLAAVALTDAATPADIQSGAWQYLTNVAGTNAITADIDGLTAYVAGQVYRFIVANTNTGAVTLNINSIGAVAVSKNGSTPLAPGDLNAGSAVEVIYDGTRFQLITPPKLRIGTAGYLYGMTLSNNGTDATNDIDFAAGECVDSTGVAFLSGGAMTKRLDASWAAGSGNGGRLSAAAIANTTYHCFAILKDSDGTVDYGFDVSPTAPTMPSGYTYFRRIGSIIRVSDAITLFDQHGDDFTLRTSVNDYNQVTPGTGPITITLASLPTGIVVEANIIVSVGGQSGSINGARMSALTSTDEAPGQSNSQVYFSNVANGVQSGQVSGVFTNTAAQIRGRIVSSATGAQLVVRSQGWTDTRGRV